MERESFEDPAVAALLNRCFVCVKIDREERPDLDEIHMTVTQLLTGSGGWPNSVWLTPDGQPWYAGTYFPRDHFLGLLQSLHRAWTERRQDVEAQAVRITAALTQALAQTPAVSDPGRTDLSTLVRRAVQGLREAFDPAHGGFDSAPKFPPHTALRFLFAAAGARRDESAADMAVATLDAMARGGIHDHVGGGFHRYSTDGHWFLPHFEKMLYDNALLLDSYSHGFVLTGRQSFRDAAKGIVEWVQREMTGPNGLFWSALDADSAGGEGEFYVWTRDQIADALGGARGERFCRAYGVEAQGNFQEEAGGRRPGTNVLSLQSGADPMPAELGLLRGLRETRSRPACDDKAIAGWNGLMISALVHASRVFARPEWQRLARRAAEAAIRELVAGDGRVGRTTRNGRLSHAGVLEDYAFLARAFLDLDAVGEAPCFRDAALRVGQAMVARFADEHHGGFFATDASVGDVLVRARSVHDTVLPAGAAVALSVLRDLAEITEEERFSDLADQTLRSLLPVADRFPRAMLWLLGDLLRERGGDAVASGLSDAVSLRIQPADVRLRSGESASVVLTVDIAAGWHVQSNLPGADNPVPLAVRLEGPPGVSLGRVDFPESELEPFLFGAQSVPGYRGSLHIGLRIETGTDAVSGPVAVLARIQPCDDSRCLQARWYRAELNVQVDT
jgi:uncharacterized protein YyaL (SSP411 family)